MSLSRLVLLSIILTANASLAFAQRPKDASDPKAWVAIMLESDAKKLLTYMAPMVDVNLPTQRGAFNQNQLQPVMSHFFRLHPPKSISIEQQGALNPRNDYFIGTYVSGDTDYRLYIQAERQSDGLKIFSISIQRK